MDTYIGIEGPSIFGKRLCKQRQTYSITDMGCKEGSGIKRNIIGIEERNSSHMLVTSLQFLYIYFPANIKVL